MLGLYVLGFTSVFREGFETVLFLQALQLEAGIGIVLAGVALGLVLTAAVGAITFTLEQRLPYKRMLVVTGVLISLVLVVLVGNTVRTLQGVGWVSITPIDVDLPLWMGTWLGVFPTWETLGAQVGALRLRDRQLLPRRVGPQARRAPEPEPAAPRNGNGNGNGRANDRSTLAPRRSTEAGPASRPLHSRPSREDPRLADDRQLGAGVGAAASSRRILVGSMKRTSSSTVRSSETSVGAALAEELDQVLDQLLGGAGAGGDADGLDSLEPLLLRPGGGSRSGARRRRARGPPRPGGPSWRSWSSRSPGSGRTRGRAP